MKMTFLGFDDMRMTGGTTNAPKPQIKRIYTEPPPTTGIVLIIRFIIYLLRPGLQAGATGLLEGRFYFVAF